MVSDRAAQTYSLDDNRRCFRAGGQTGYGSELAYWAWSAVPMAVFRPSVLRIVRPKLSVL